RHFFRGQVLGEGGNKDVTWLAPSGAEMTDADWQARGGHALGMLIDGDATDETDARGRPIKGDTLLLLLNGGDQPVHFQLPSREAPGRWAELVDTASSETHTIDEEAGVMLEPFSLVLLRYGREHRAAEPAANEISRGALAGAGDAL
ncbi:MAG TPA: hypothetical protein VFS05_04175, partial [Gemmatimonadaceae bacterium]|nr:hypothetical protein [Gemmatimonadaceae bacterium]